MARHTCNLRAGRNRNTSITITFWLSAAVQKETLSQGNECKDRAEHPKSFSGHHMHVHTRVHTPQTQMGLLNNFFHFDEVHPVLIFSRENGHPSSFINITVVYFLDDLIYIW